ncbi:MAG TPA: tetratricopeptide repeat protein [Gemmatimonadaceae bacterium]|nr:tetratricopeptide repeat protein [Gemmatimonadaceae bacterium]
MSAAATARPMAAAHGGELDILRSFARRIDPSDAGAYNNLGVLYFRKGLTDEAIVAFSRALALDERMHVARRNLEIAYGESGLLERRLKQLEERLRTNPADLEALVQSGIAEKTAGRLERAHSLFQRAIDLDPDSSVLHFLLAETLYNRGLHEEALRSVRSSIEINPENPDALYLIGFILGDLGRAEEAADANRRAVQLNPTLVKSQANLSLEMYRHEATPSQAHKTSAGAHITLGRALRQKGYFQEALREYERAIEGGEANAEVLQAMLELYLLQRDTGAAIATADRFAREFSPTAKTWNGRGVALQLAGRHAEAEESYNRALSVDSSYPYAHNNLGVLLWHKHDTKSAINSFRRALQAPNPPVEARLNLALGLFRRKHIELALEAYRQVLAAAPEHPVAWNGIGLILVELEKYSDARNAFARAIQANPDFAEAHYNMSFTLSNLGDFTAALRETKRALELDPMYTPQKLELAIELPHEEIRLTVAPPITEKDESADHVADFHFDPAIIEELFAEKRSRKTPYTPEDPLAGFALARDLITKGLYDRAQGEIARVLARGGDKVLGLVLAGDGFAAQGLHGEGLERYRRALEMDENNTYARQGIARSLLALGRPDEARPYAEALVEAGSTDVNLLLLAAEARVASLDKDGARDILIALQQNEGRNANVLKRVGDLYAALNDTHEAIAAYRGSLSIDERQVDTHIALGRLLAKSGDDPGAIRELESVLVTAPNNDTALVELVAPYRRTGRSRSALPRIVALIRRDVYHFAGLIALGEILIDLARESDALRAFERVLRFDPNHSEAMRYRRLLLKGRV